MRELFALKGRSTDAYSRCVGIVVPVGAEQCSCPPPVRRMSCVAWVVCVFCCLRHAAGRLPRYERVRQFVGKQSGTDDVRDWDVARVCASKAAARGLLEGGARSSASARSVAVLHLRARPATIA